MLYAGARSRTTSTLALTLRGESYAEGSDIQESDREVVAAAMESLLHSLGEDLAAPAWIESDGADSYRLIRSVAAQRVS